MVLENEADYKSRSQVISSLSKKFGCSGDTLRGWVKKQDVESGTRDRVTQSERDELKALHREICKLTQAHEILRKASAFFAAADLDRLLKR
ncbi:MAG: transposase [Yoonia sp.]|jgi:transposase